MKKTLDGSDHFFATQDAAQHAYYIGQGWTDTDPPGDLDEEFHRLLTTLDEAVPSGVATLGSDGKLISGQLPVSVTGLTYAQVAAMFTAASHTGATVAYDSTAHTITITVTAGGLDSEAVQDLVAAFIDVSTLPGLTKTYDDAGNKLELGVDLEYLQDQVAAMVNGTHSGLTVAYDDPTGKLTFTVSGASTPADDSITTAMLQDEAVTAAKVDPTEVPIFDAEGAVALDDGASRDAGTAATHGDVDDLAATILGAIYAKYLARSVLGANADGTPVAVQNAAGTDAVLAIEGDALRWKPQTELGSGGGVVTSIPAEQTIYTYPDNARSWAAAFADAISPIPAVGPARVAMVGDSVTEGLYGKPVMRLRNRLTRFNGNGTLDPGWVNADTTTLSTSTYQFGLTTGSAGASEGQTNFRRSIGPARYAYKLGSGSVLTLQDVANATAPVTVDAIEVAYIASGDATTGNLVVKLDGTTIGTITCYDSLLGAGVEKVRKVEYAVTRARYSSITVTGAGGNPATFVGVGLWDRAKVRVYNFGHTGLKYSDFKGNLDTDPAASYAALGMDAVITGLGINDYGDGVTTLQSNMSSFLVQVATKSPGVSQGVLIPYGISTRANWRSTFAPAMKATAAALSLPVVDTSWMLATNASTDPRDLIANVDNVHMNASGGELWASLLSRFLLGDDVDWTKAPSSFGNVVLFESSEPPTPVDSIVQWSRDNAGVTEWCFKGPDGTVHVISSNTAGGTVDGVDAAFVVPTPGDDDTSGILMKSPSSTWGVHGETAGGGDPLYGTGQFIQFEKEGAGTPSDNLLFRVDRTGGLGMTGAMHLATGLRQRTGYGPGQCLWVNPSVDALGIVIDNPATADVATWTRKWLTCVDIRSTPNVEVFSVDQDAVYVRHTGGLKVDKAWGAFLGTAFGISLFVNPPNTTDQALVVRGKASHTADLIRAETSAAVAKFSVGPQGMVDAPNTGPSRTRYRLIEHFETANTQATNGGQLGGSTCSVALSGAGASFAQGSVFHASIPNGAALGTTGTATTGVAMTNFLGISHVFTAATSDFVFGARPSVTTLSDVTNQFEVRVGLSDGLGGAANNGVYFRIQHGDANWEAVTRQGGTETVTNTGIAAVAGVFLNLKIVYTPGGNAVFYVNGAQVASHSTNKPTDSTNLLIGGAIIKAAGTTARSFFLDLLAWDTASDIDLEQCLAA